MDDRNHNEDIDDNQSSYNIIKKIDLMSWNFRGKSKARMETIKVF